MRKAPTGSPWYLNSGPTFYNKAVLEECGITVDPNDPPTKQDDIFAMADTFGSNCGGKYALTSGIPSIQDFGMYGVELMNKDHTESRCLNESATPVRLEIA